MRVLSVVPRYAVTVGSLKARRGGTVIGKTREERGKFHLEFILSNFALKKTRQTKGRHAIACLP